MHVLNEMTIEATKTKILSALQKNRRNHLEELEESREAFFKLAKQQLEESLEDVKDREEDSVRIHLDYPTGHLDAYDTAISMLKLHTEDTITLNSTQVRCLIDDEWDWQQQFKFQNSTYVSSVRG